MPEYTRHSDQESFDLESLVSAVESSDFEKQEAERQDCQVGLQALCSLERRLVES